MHTASRSSRPAYLPQHEYSSSRRMPISTSLPQTSWLLDATEFNPPTSSQSHRGLGMSPIGTAPFSSGSSYEPGKRSHTIQRVPSRDHLLSTSPTSGIGTRARHSPSPVPSPSHTLHPSQSFTALSLHKTSGASSDASGHLDLKRLMSKPAKQTPSGSVSLLSDSERSGDASSSRVLPSRRPSEGPIHHPPLSKSVNVSREKVSLHVNTTGLRSSSAPRYDRNPPERRPLATSNSQSSKPVRNVLRRRSSARSNPGVSPVAHPHAPMDESYSPSRSLAKHSQAALRDEAPFTAYHTTSPSTSATRSVTSPRTKTSSSSPRNRGSSGLTPAGAVVLAYKQQEQRREELAETASFNDAYRPASVQKSSRLSNDDDDEHGGGPYYTVYGSTSGRLVAVGSPEDNDLHFDPRGANMAHGKSSSYGQRSLTRKVSGSLKRVTGSIKRDRDHREPPAIRSGEWKLYNGASPGYSGHSPSVSKSKSARKALALDTTMQETDNVQGSPGSKMSPAAKNSASPQEDGRMSRASKSKTKDREEDLSPGGKWWKLMKRISTGGLRDKFLQDDAPPVPPLPQNISLTPSRTTMDISSRGLNGMEVSENGVLLRRFMQSRASLSGVRPTLPSSSKASSGSSRPSIGTATANTPKSQSRTSVSGHRPSMATRSSSPSSEMASSGLFHHTSRTQSSRSSFSSLGEEVPPIPRNVGQYIVPPSELSRLTKFAEQTSSSSRFTRSRTQSRSQTAPPEGVSSQEDRNINILSLPLPPRRAATGGDPSPLAPSFNVEDTINDLMPPQPQGPPPLTEFGMKEAPPRPHRNTRRTAIPNVDIPVRSQSMSATTAHTPPQVRVNVGALSYASTAKQISSTSPSTGPSSSTSPSTGPSSSTSPSSSSQKRSPLTFRVLESPRQRLTEKEKADKWDDLLERSARAGGTLHIGEMPLLSEQPDAADGASYRGYDSD